MTNQLRQAARMALEALQLCANGEDDVLLTRDALSSLRQALDQPKQEPAGWQWMGTGHYRKHLPKDAEKYCWKPLYTEPPKRKPLTDEEICEMADATPVGEMADADTWHIRFARAIEAKLKERNA